MAKKSQSQIITAVLLILIVIGLSVIILNFSTSFVKEKLESTGCFDVIGQLSFVNSNKYTCYDDIQKKVRLKVHLGDLETISDFLIEVGGADTKSIKITEGANITGVKMFNGTQVLEMPKKNEERTYVIDVNEKPESVKIHPIINNKEVCEVSDSLDSLGICR